MSRAETTAMLSKLVEKRLRNQTAFWASEVNFDRNTPDERRVDYVGFKPWNINGEPVPASEILWAMVKANGKRTN